MLKKYEVSVVYKTGEYKAKSDTIFIMEAMFRGTKRNIESEPDPKNAGAE